MVEWNLIQPDMASGEKRKMKVIVMSCSRWVSPLFFCTIACGGLLTTQSYFAQNRNARNVRSASNPGLQTIPHGRNRPRHRRIRAGDTRKSIASRERPVLKKQATRPGHFRQMARRIWRPYWISILPTPVDCSSVPGWPWREIHPGRAQSWCLGEICQLFRWPYGFQSPVQLSAEYVKIFQYSAISLLEAECSYVRHHKRRHTDWWTG